MYNMIVGQANLGNFCGNRNYKLTTILNNIIFI